jgi:hypothetical protein
MKTQHRTPDRVSESVSERPSEMRSEIPARRARGFDTSAALRHRPDSASGLRSRLRASSDVAGSEFLTTPAQLQISGVVRN